MTFELSNEQEQTQLFFCQMEKALSGSNLAANSLTSFFSNFFNLILISHSQSVFQTFFSLRQPYTLPRKIEGKNEFMDLVNTHQYINCDFLMSPPSNFLFFYEVAQFLPIYCSNVYKYDLLRRW